MLISKFDLYRSEWLELVFDDRNKEYGAYDLRKHYAGNLVKAMGISFAGISLLFLGYGVFSNHTPIGTHKETPVELDKLIIIQPPTVLPPKAQPRVMPPASHAPTTQYVEFVPKPIEEAVNPPTTIDIAKTAIGPATTSGNGTDQNTLNTNPGTGPGTVAPPDNTPVDAGGLDVMPEPYGGASAWSKFLQKNIHYPAQATEEGKQGKVYLSFIIEKDGQLSNITVIRGVGFGLDEEALRVLRKAPAWKPGMQNGHAVRVKYTIPINFTIADNND
ncbi:MAG: TonB family protein [Mucilaginibacter sp.]